MRIWWCQEHEHPGLAENVCFYPLWYQHKMEGRMSAFREAAASCRMVPMRLIADDIELMAMVSQVIGEQIEYQPGYWVWQMETEIRDAFVRALTGETL